MVKIFREPYAPARAAIEQLAKDHPEQAASISRILRTIDHATAGNMLGQEHETDFHGNVRTPAPAEGQEILSAYQLSAEIARIVEAVAPVNFERFDDVRIPENAAKRLWLENTFDLLGAHIDC